MAVLRAKARALVVLVLLDAAEPRRAVELGHRAALILRLVMVTSAAARRGLTMKWLIGTGTIGAGAWRKAAGASPLCSIARHAPRSAASAGQRAWSRRKMSMASSLQSLPMKAGQLVVRGPRRAATPPPDGPTGSAESARPGGSFITF